MIPSKFLFSAWYPGLGRDAPPMLSRLPVRRYLSIRGRYLAQQLQ